MVKAAVLHELLAVEGDLEGVCKRVLDETKHTLGTKEDHFFGFNRKFEAFDSEDQTKYPEESKELVTTVGDKLAYMMGHVVRYYDAIAQKEATNQVAKADLVVGGTTLATGLPATLLLGLETRLKSLRGVLDNIPTLAPGVSWQLDENRGKGVYIAPPEEKLKSEKTVKHKIVAEATKEHPAQVVEYPETKNVGKYTRLIWSGMMTPLEKSAILGRIDKLIRAAKQARQRANTTEVVKLEIGKVITEYILG